MDGYIKIDRYGYQTDRWINIKMSGLPGPRPRQWWPGSVGRSTCTGQPPDPPTTQAC